MWEANLSINKTIKKRKSMKAFFFGLCQKLECFREYSVRVFGNLHIWLLATVNKRGWFAFWILVMI